jgi:hypothetical protein
MGEARRRREHDRLWRAGLGDDEQIIVKACERLLHILPPIGVCYRSSLFLQYHLKFQHGLAGEAVIGFVNDRTDEMYASHAWFMFRGKRTDLAISRPRFPELQRPGPLVILDHVLTPGYAWDYYIDRPQAAIDYNQRLLSDPRARLVIEEAEAQHSLIMDAASSDTKIREYLDGAPDGLNYQKVALFVG